MTDADTNPYASPTTSTEEQPIAFRIAPVFTVVGVTLLVFLVSLTTLLIVNGGRIDPFVLGGLIGNALLFGPGLAIAVILFFPVYVSPAGLRCYNFWGVYGPARWDDIQSATRINLVGFRYLRVVSRGRNTPLWVPLFLAKKREFAEQVREFAGEENAVSRALDQVI